VREIRIAEVEMKRFEIITEVEARVLDIGSTVELIRGGRVTPLARDTLEARRVTVLESVDAANSEISDRAFLITSARWPLELIILVSRLKPN